MTIVIEESKSEVREGTTHGTSSISGVNLMNFLNLTCCSRFFTKMFRASKVKVNVAEITSDKAQPTTPIDKTFPSTNEINRTISIESDGKASINSAKDRRISVDVTYWIPSNTEKVILRKTWSDDFDFLYNLGAKIYIYIFENEPEAKKLFPKIHQHGEKFKESEEFRSQALKFVQTLSICIDHLDNTNHITKILHAIGERHVAFSDQFGFKPKHWDIFLDALEVALSEHIESFKNFDETKKEEAIFVWRKLAQYVITHMKRGYVEGLVKKYHNSEDVSLVEFNKAAVKI